MCLWFILCVLLGLTTHLSVSQPLDLLPELLNSYPASRPQEIRKPFDKLIVNLEQKRHNRTDKEFLSLVFHESHRKFFKTYQPYAQFAQVLEAGTYDCLSATSFLSVLLERFDYDFKIIETNYHIFLLVETSKGQVLIESTDRMNGIVSDPIQIDRRISKYQSNDLIVASSEAGKIHYEYNLNLYQLVKPNQLPGLLYFNQAVSAYNDNNLIACAGKLDYARRIYESPRTAEFAVILVKSIVVSDLNEETKKELIKPFIKYLGNTNSVIASR